MEGQWIEIASTVANLIFVVLAARNRVLCWPFGILGALLAGITYTSSRLYSDASLQVFYVIMGIYGWITWARMSQESIEVRPDKLIAHFVVVMVGAIGIILLGLFWRHYGGDIPFVDAATTSFSIAATILQARRLRSNWIYWIIIDTACVFIYYYKELYWFSGLFVVYAIIAIYGYSHWTKLQQKQSTLESI